MKQDVDASRAKVYRYVLTAAGATLIVVGVVLSVVGIWNPIPTAFENETMADPRFVNTGILFACLGVVASLVRWMLWMSDEGKW